MINFSKQRCQNCVASLFFCICIFAILSCSSVPKVVPFIKDNGIMMYHLMPIELKNKNVDFFSVEMTVFISNDKVESDTQVNYSLVLKNPKDISNAKIGILIHSEKIYFEENSILYKDIFKKNSILIRFSAVLSQEHTEKLLKNNEPVKLFIETDSIYEEFYSKKIQEQINQLRIII